MCGLVGCAGSIAKKEKDAFSFMLHLDVFRGKHSTGVASVGADGGWQLVKRVGTAWDLFDTKAYSSLMTYQTYALIGHNRAATKGKVTNVNAHPFEFQDVVGAHNGTLRGQYRLPDHTRFDVDSENIFYSIQHEGLEETLQNLDGAYALTYWDKRSEEMVLVRNDERTLFYCFSKDGKTVFWASEAWILSVALSKHKIEFDQINTLATETIYRFQFERKLTTQEPVSLTREVYEEPHFPFTYYGGKPGGNKGKKAAQQTPAKKETSKLPGKSLKVDPQGLVHKRVEFTVRGKDVSAFGQEYFDCSPLCDESLEMRLYIHSKVAESYDDIMAVKDDTIFSAEVVSYRDGILFGNPNTFQESEEEEDDSEEVVEGYAKELLNTSEFLIATRKGCCCCGDPVMWQQAEELVWIDKDEVICPSCKDMDWVKEYIMEVK